MDSIRFQELPVFPEGYKSDRGDINTQKSLSAGGSSPHPLCEVRTSSWFHSGPRGYRKWPDPGWTSGEPWIFTLGVLAQLQCFLVCFFLNTKQSCVGTEVQWPRVQWFPRPQNSTDTNNGSLMIWESRQVKKTVSLHFSLPNTRKSQS